MLPQSRRLRRLLVAYSVNELGTWFGYAALAVGVQANLPIAVALVWITNPLTMPLLFFLAYKLGAWLLGLPPQGLDFHLSMPWLMHGLAMVWKPFLLGCLVCGLGLGAIGYIGMHLAWRGHVVYRHRRRRLSRRLVAS